METTHAERALSALQLETAKNHRAASEKVLEKVAGALDMRSVCLAQMATSILTNSHPNWPGCTPREAVLMAREILEEVEHPSPEPKPEPAPTKSKLELTGDNVFTPHRPQPRRIGWYDTRG